MFGFIFPIFLPRLGIYCLFLVWFRPLCTFRGLPCGWPNGSETGSFLGPPWRPRAPHPPQSAPKHTTSLFAELGAEAQASSIVLCDDHVVFPLFGYLGWMVCPGFSTCWCFLFCRHDPYHRWVRWCDTHWACNEGLLYALYYHRCLVHMFCGQQLSYYV